MGEEKLQDFINFSLKYLSELRLPVKRYDITLYSLLHRLTIHFSFLDSGELPRNMVESPVMVTLKRISSF